MLRRFLTGLIKVMSTVVKRKEFCVSERLRFVGSSLAQQPFVSPCGLLVAGGEYGWAQCSRTTSVAAESDFRFQVQNAASIPRPRYYRLEDLPIANQIIPPSATSNRQPTVNTSVFRFHKLGYELSSFRLKLSSFAHRRMCPPNRNYNS